MLIAGSEDFTPTLMEELGNVGGKTVAMPIGVDAGVITSLVRTDGILCIPQDISGLFDMICGRRKNSFSSIGNHHLNSKSKTLDL